MKNIYFVLSIIVISLLISNKNYAHGDEASSTASCAIIGTVTSNPSVCWNSPGCKPYQISVDKYRCVQLKDVAIEKPKKNSTIAQCAIAGKVTSNPSVCWNSPGCKPFQISVDKYRCVQWNDRESESRK
jgi:hypothetical protein